jgi:hypothetical protein
MSKQTAELCVALKDAIYFIKKGEPDKAINILTAIIKRFAPKVQDNDPMPQ